MNKSKISLYFIFIAFFTFLAIFITIVQASYNNLTDPTKQVESDKYLEPLNPVLDSEIIQEIEKRQAPSENSEMMINNSDINTTDNFSDNPPEVTITPILDDNIQPIPTTEENI